MRNLHRLSALGAAAIITAISTAPVAAEGEPSAATVDGYPAVGAVFNDDNANGDHFCSGSVVHSATHDLVMTAAHCIDGDGSDLTFAPGYDQGAKPHGVWKVEKVYAETAWVTSQDPRDDYVLLKIAPQSVGGTTLNIEDVTGGYTLGTKPQAGAPMLVSGYNGGTDDKALSCAAKVSYSHGYPTFACHDFVGGTSGSPWIQATKDGHGHTRNTIRGVIGGLNQGGCTEAESHSSPFTEQVFALLARAEAGGPGTYMPIPGSDGC